MEFKTSISKITNEDVVIRERKLSSLMKEASFTDGVFLILKGSYPTEQESKLFSAMLLSIIDHGMGTTSALTSRFIASTGNDVNVAIGGGVLALGDLHGGAIENCMAQLLEFSKLSTDALTTEITKCVVDKKGKLFGFGHKHYKVFDPRAKILLDFCKDFKYSSQFIDLVVSMEQLIETVKGKKLVLNVDGLLSALLLSMGFSPIVGKGFFIIGRVPGLVAQVIEEIETEKPVRRLDESEIKYLPKG